MKNPDHGGECNPQERSATAVGGPATIQMHGGTDGAGDSLLGTGRPKVSVIMPTHNRAAMLRRAIDSVLSQTYGDLELIIISDGSTDTTSETVASYSDPRIRYFKHDTSRGASAARNTGLRASRGDFIAFLDDDDEWTRDRLEIQLPVLEDSSPDVGLVYGWMQYIRDQKVYKIHKPVLKGNVFVQMLDDQAIGGCPTVMIKREVMDRVGLFDEELFRGNDGDYWRRISQYYQVDYVPYVLANIYVGHEDRISVRSSVNLRNAIHSIEKRLAKFADVYKQYPVQACNARSQILAMRIHLKDYVNAMKDLLDIIKRLNVRCDHWFQFVKQRMVKK